MNFLRSSAALVLATAALRLYAGAEGRVLGRVTDAVTGKGIEGVKITITSPVVRTFKLELTTKADGKWERLFVDAVPKYHYKFEKEGYQTIEDDYKIKIGDMNAQLDLKLTPATAAAPAQEVKADPFVENFNAAVEAYQANDLETASTKIAAATQAGPDKANGFDLGARIAYKKKDWDKTIEYGEKSLKLDSDNPDVTTMLLEAYKAKGDKEKVKEYQEKFNSQNADKPEFVLNNAVALFNKGDFKGAEPLLKKVLAAQPENPKAHYLLGMSYANLGKIGDMRTHLNEYLKLEPSGKDANAAKEMLEAYKGM
jgi:tetratricopeptide (TPR) repeat protein